MISATSCPNLKGKAQEVVCLTYNHGEIAIFQLDKAVFAFVWRLSFQADLARK